MPKEQIEIAIPSYATTKDSTRRACAVLERSSDTCNHFLNLFDAATSKRGRGATSDTDQELLRAMLLFACAGLDSAVGHLMRDCAVEMLPRSKALQNESRSFAGQKLSIPPEGASFLLKVLDKAQSGVEDLVVEEMMIEKTRHSLQSHEELLRMSSLFEIADGNIRPQIRELRDVFKARNVITHEMDVDFDGSGPRPRVSRRRDDMVKYTTQVLEVAAQLIAATQKKLQ